MEEKIQSYIRLLSGNIELNICVTDKLKKQEGDLKDFGYIKVSSGTIDKESLCFWDNLSYLFDISAKKFKKECKKELKLRGFKVKEAYKDIKRLLDRAFELGILTKE